MRCSFGFSCGRIYLGARDFASNAAMNITWPMPAIYNRRMHDVVVYSRPGCHLCDVVKDTLRQLRYQADFQWREIDIDSDPDLQRIYNDEIPVVLINGRKAFKYHMPADAFLRTLSARNER